MPIYRVVYSREQFCDFLINAETEREAQGKAHKLLNDPIAFEGGISEMRDWEQVDTDKLDADEVDEGEVIYE
jgi:hypothetical protein